MNLIVSLLISSVYLFFFPPFFSPQHMESIGNTQARKYYECNLPPNFRRPQTDSYPFSIIALNSLFSFIQLWHAYMYSMYAVFCSRAVSQLLYKARHSCACTCFGELALHFFKICLRLWHVIPIPGVYKISNWLAYPEIFLLTPNQSLAHTFQNEYWYTSIVH